MVKYTKAEIDKNGNPYYEVPLDFRITIRISVVSKGGEKFWFLFLDDNDNNFPGLNPKNNALRLWDLEEDPEGEKADQLLTDIMSMFIKKGKSVQEAYDYARYKV